MGRPRKSDIGPIPTRERLFRKALELFSLKGFDAVSVREITKALGLNEATLYIHFKNKAGLLEEILGRMEQKLLIPGFSSSPPEFYTGQESFDLAESLIAGAKLFFGKADAEITMTWRMLMISQYKFVLAREGVERNLLDAPVNYFSRMLATLQQVNLVRPDTDTRTAGRMLAAIFFDYSFRANLREAWKLDYDDLFLMLAEELRQFSSFIEQK